MLKRQQQTVAHAARVLAAILCLGSPFPASAQQQDPAPPPEVIREIFVPFDDLNVLLEGSDVQRVFLTRDEYRDLLKKAKQSPAQPQASISAAVIAADYSVTIEEGRAKLTGELLVEVLEDGLHVLPLEFNGVGLRIATLDDQPAAIGLNEHRQPVLFVSGKGRHRLNVELVAAVQIAAAQQSLQFQLPTPAATQLKLAVPGNVEVKGGASVIRRTLAADGNTTNFELLPSREPMSLVMSLNNRLLQREHVIVARSVIVDEVTTGYERIHATVSAAVLHGAVEKLQFSVPAGFEVSDVQGELLSRWVIEKTPEGNRLDVILREPSKENVVLNISATRTPPLLTGWSLPQLRPLNVAGEVAVVGLLVEDRLQAESLTPTGLQPVDNGVLTAALPASLFQIEPGMPTIRPIAAYYAPQKQYDLKADFRAPPDKLKTTTNVVLTLDKTRHTVRGGFALLPEAEKRFDFHFTMPAGWDLNDVTDSAGAALRIEKYPQPDGSARVHVRLPQGVPPGTTANVVFTATREPAGWLDVWTKQTVEFPMFAIEGAADEVGAIAVHADDDFLVRPETTEGLSPLDENEKEKYGIGGIATNLAYRYESRPYRAVVTVERKTPLITARAFSFFRIEPSGLVCHYELVYDVQQAGTRVLSLLLPKSTPTSLAIRGLDGVAIKEFFSEDAGESDRRWRVELAESHRDNVRLAVDFTEDMPEGDQTDFALPLVRADGVGYQSAVVAVEGSAELDIDVKTTARRVDVGELVAAEYQVGKRLLGAFTNVGPAAATTVDVHRRPGYGLPPVIVQRAEMVTLLSASGRNQTAARFQLRTKANFLEVRIAEPKTLWSIVLDGQPVAPQRDGDSVLLSLPAAAADQLRDLTVVYEQPAGTIRLFGQVDAVAPRLFLRDERDGEPRPVPNADLHWRLVLPDGHQLVRSRGTVFTNQLPTKISPTKVVAKTVYRWLGGVDWFYGDSMGGVAGVASKMNFLGGMQAAREGAHRYAAPANAPYGYFADESVQSFAQTESAPQAAGAEVYDMPMATPPMVTAEPMAPPMEMPQDARRELTRDESAPESPKSEADAPPPPTAQPAPAPAVDPAAVPQIVPTTPPAEQPADGLEDRFDATRGKDQLWALEGVRSLKIDIQAAGDQIAFQSLGVDPRLQVTLVNRNRVDSLALGIGLAIIAIGLMQIRCPAKRQARYVIVVAVAALLLPLITGWQLELGQTFDMAFIAACALVPVYVAAALVRCASAKCCPTAICGPTP